ncbi:Interleukin-32 [Manis pentadactyla]|nr:Interleukin-32 [Manis pentadactyla]
MKQSQEDREGPRCKARDPNPDNEDPAVARRGRGRNSTARRGFGPARSQAFRGEGVARQAAARVGISLQRPRHPAGGARPRAGGPGARASADLRRPAPLTSPPRGRHGNGLTERASEPPVSWQRPDLPLPLRRALGCASLWRQSDVNGDGACRGGAAAREAGRAARASELTCGAARAAAVAARRAAGRAPGAQAARAAERAAERAAARPRRAEGGGGARVGFAGRDAAGLPFVVGWRGSGSTPRRSGGWGLTGSGGRRGSGSGVRSRDAADHRRRGGRRAGAGVQRVRAAGRRGGRRERSARPRGGSPRPG